MNLKSLASLGLALSASTTFAQWTGTDITPAAFPRAAATGASANRWCGTGFPAAGGRHAIVSTGGVTQDLTTGNYSSGDALACTDTLTVGTGQGIATNGYIQPVFWRADGSAVNLTSPRFIEGTANGVWGPYIVGGLSNNGVAQQLQAIVWFSSPFSYTLLPTPGFNTSSANAIQQLNVVGYMDNSIDGSTSHAALWRGFASNPIDLNPLPTSISKANAIDGSTEVGVSDNRPCLWQGTAGSFVDLLPAGFVSGAALGVLGNTEVGQVTDSGNATHAALWRGSTGSFVDLDQFLPANLGHGVAQSIVMQGQNVVISGYAFDTNTGDIHSVQWTRPLYRVQLMTTGSDTYGAAYGIHGQYLLGYTTTDNINFHGCIWDISTGAQIQQDGIDQINTMYGGLIGGNVLSNRPNEIGVLKYGTRSYNVGVNIAKITGDGHGQPMEIGLDNSGAGAVWFGLGTGPVFPPNAGFTNPVVQNGENGALVGWGGSGSNSHALYWPDAFTQPVDLGTNALGLCGNPTVQGGIFQNHAAIWYGSAASRVDLNGTEVDDIYGQFQVGRAPNAAVWQGTSASKVDLNALLPSGYFSSALAASSFNGNLVIGGYAHGPIPSPTVPCLWTRDAP